MEKGMKWKIKETRTERGKPDDDGQRGSLYIIHEYMETHKNVILGLQIPFVQLIRTRSAERLPTRRPEALLFPFISRPDQTHDNRGATEPLDRQHRPHDPIILI